MKSGRGTFILFFIIACFSGLMSVAQTLIMNEVSNGPSGNQEYVEFVVVSNTVTYNCSNSTPPCIDIRGWIFDDNSGYHGSAGIASGAVRFSQNPVWACVPLGTIILIYNNADRNPAIPPDDLSMSDGNCTIIAPLNSNLFESNPTTPGASACSYPVSGWVSGGSWNNTLLANGGDCARIVNLAGCEVFSLCWGTDNQNNLIYFSGAGGQKVWYFNNGNPSLQANWSSGSASPSPGNQTPGAPNNVANAAYIAQFNNGCMPITQLSVTANATAAGCSCNGSATASASGSIGSYTYQWFDASMNPIGQTSATATNLCAGLYYVTATSHIGCTATTSVSVGSSGTLSVTVNSATICAGSTAVLQATPSAAGGTFSWTPGGQNTSSISVNPATTATYAVTYTQGGCAVTAVANVSVNPLPTLIANSTSVCAGQSATVSASGASTYTWSTGSTTQGISVVPSVTSSYTVVGALAGCTNSAVATVSVGSLPTVSVNNTSVCVGQSATLTATGATTYTWNTGATGASQSVSPVATGTYTVSGTLAGCTNSAVATVSVVSNPTVTVNSSTICAGQAATLTATGATTYSWSEGSTGPSIMVSPVSTTGYTVTGNTAGCTNTATGTVAVGSLIPMSINSVSICVGQSATLTASGASSYLWNTGATTNSLVVTPSVTTTYSLTGTVGTCTGSVTATVQVNSIPVISVNSSTICAGETATLTASGAATYTWSNGASGSAISVAPTSTSAYTVSGTQTGCTNSVVSTVSVIPVPAITVNSASICSGQSATLTASGAGTYTWSNGSSSSSISVTPSVTSVYTVTGMQASCTGSTAAFVSVMTTPTLAVNSATICTGKSATLSAGGATTYSWSTGATNNNLVVSPSTTTTYTITGFNGSCTDTQTVEVMVSPAPQADFISDKQEGCAPLCVSFSDQSASGANWLWNFGDGVTSGSQNPEHCYNNTGTYDVSLMLTSANGCTSTKLIRQLIHVYPQPQADFSYDSGSGQDLGSEVSFTNYSSNATQYQWSFGDSTISSEISPVHVFEQEGLYEITLIASNDKGCTDTEKVRIEVKGAFTFYAPDTFTPNNDKINDVFYPIGTGWNAEDYSLRIFDRWGMEIFHSNDPAIGWDGKNNRGEVLLIDTYTWKVELQDIYKTRHYYIGRITLLK